MAWAIVLLVVFIASAHDAHAGERRSGDRSLHLATPELLSMLDPTAFPSSPAAPAAAPIEQTFEHGDRRGRAMFAILDQLTKREIDLRPFFTLLPAAPAPRARTDSMMPMVAFGARVQGRTLVAFTRPGAPVDPDDNVVYQRIVASDLIQGRRFSVTVYEDHALGKNSAQMLGVGARLTFRPTLDVAGWRTRIELFGSYDLTAGATGYLGIVAKAPPAPPPAHAPAGY
jgi:hypothetical protein